MMWKFECPTLTYFGASLHETIGFLFYQVELADFLFCEHAAIINESFHSQDLMPIFLVIGLKTLIYDQNKKEKSEVDGNYLNKQNMNKKQTKLAIET